MHTVRTDSNASRAGILILVLVTALIHFSRAGADPDIRVLFILNGLGYLALGVLLYLPQARNWRRWVRRILMGYTALTVALYLLWAAMSSDWTVPLGPINLVVELLLIGLLWREGRSSRYDPAARW